MRARGVRPLLIAALLAIASLGSPALGDEGDNEDDDLEFEHLAYVTTDGSERVAHIAYYEDSDPTNLVVFVHGYGNTVHGAWLDHMARTARPDTAVLATDFRDNDMFPILKGAEDTIMATIATQALFPTIEKTYLFGVSMGGAISGVALAESIQYTDDGSALYDIWIDVEGVSMPAETWAEAAAVGHPAAGHIEHDAGGTPYQVPGEYTRRSPALRALDMAAGGLERAVVIHPINDGQVPYNQGREMAKALVAAGIDTEMYTVTRVAPDADEGTTGTSVILGAANDPNGEHLHLAGHAWEGDPDHPVMRTAFARLNEFLDGDLDGPSYREAVVDDAL